MANNEIRISGFVRKKPRFKYQNNDGTRYHQFYIEYERLSGKKDIVPVLAEYEMCKFIKPNKRVIAYGSIETFNREVKGKNKVDIYVKAFDVQPHKGKDVNKVYMYQCPLCKKPLRRKSSLNKIPITQFIVASRDEPNKTSFIPVVFIGEDMEEAHRSKFKVAEEIESIVGQLRSRDYIKILEDGSYDNRVAYEVVATNMVR